MTNIIFVLGAGRSGTHMVGEYLSYHKDITGYIEAPQFFDLSKKISIYQQTNLISALVKKYQIELKYIKTKYMLDKSHSNIWFIEELKKEFPDSLLITVERNPFGMINSMMHHPGVLNWYKILDLKKINPFLGINTDNILKFSHYSLVEMCAHKWIAHHNRIIELEKKYKIIKINYDIFVENIIIYFNDFNEHLDISNITNFPITNTKRSKWKTELSHINIKKIQNIIHHCVY